MNNQEPRNIEAEMNALGCAYLNQSALDKVCDELGVIRSKDVGRRW